MRGPELSVILVSDYAGGGPHAWDDARASLEALGRQTTTASVEVIVSECEQFRESVPADLDVYYPGVRVTFSGQNASYALKNAGVEAAAAPLIAILDADCKPDQDWIERMLAAFERYPDAAAISGRTVYAGNRFIERASALLTRSYLDLGKPGPAKFISNNNAVWKREAHLAHPLPTDAGPFAARMQSEAVLREGRKIYFEPAARVTHAFEGFQMEADIRRNIGYGTILTRLKDRRLPWSWLTRLGFLSIPLVVGGKTLLTLRDCLRCRPHFRVKRHELPAVFGLAVAVNLLEAPGMWRAFAGQPIRETEYR